MTEHPRAAEYLQPPLHSVWQWRDEGQVVAWADGKTIAFRGELEVVLRRLAPQGLPPLTAILLLLAACRDNWRETSSEVGTLAGLLVSVQRRTLPGWLPEVLAGLDRVRSLPDELRRSAEAKAELADQVLETCSARTTPDWAAAVLRELAMGPPTTPRSSFDPWCQSLSDLFTSLECLRGGLPKVDSVALALRRRTGLEQLVEPAELETPAGARELISRLLDDQELGGVARLARNLMAAVTLPRPIAEREDLPLGGVSDISNRGPLDRLLLSELAHDDLTLAVRVAVNEALYLRREAPPRNPPRWRAVLLDSGLRMWGTPRVFAAAVALALSATTDRNTRIVAFRASGSGVTPVDLRTRAGLVAHLEALEPAAHPGEALGAFARILRDGLDEADPVLITGDDVLADREFQQALAAAEIPLVYVAAVNREGWLRITGRGLRGSRPIREARLNLGEILAPPKRPATPLVRKDVAKDLPAIFHVQPVPLRLPHQIDVRRLWPVPTFGLLAIAPDRRLMYWDHDGREPEFGPRQVAEQVPGGMVQWVSPTGEGSVTRAVVGPAGRQQYHLLTVDVERGVCRSCPLQVEGRGLRAIAGHGGMIFAIARRRVAVLETSEGRLVQSLHLPKGVAWRRDRFFRSRKEWLALSYDGMRVRLAPVVAMYGRAAPPFLVGLFDCTGRDGPLGVTEKGNLYDCATGELVPLKEPIYPVSGLRAALPNGKRIVLFRPPRGPREQPWHVVDVESLTATAYYSEQRALMRMHGVTRWMELNCANHSPLRWRFRHVGRLAGMLLLLTRGRQRVRAGLDRNSRLVLESLVAVAFTGDPGPFKPSAGPPFDFAPFEPTPGPPGAGFRLKVAQWPDGSRVWTDSRGLLHLKSSDPKLPELTLVMCEGELAGWCSDGRVFGPRFYLGGDQPLGRPMDPTATAAEIVEQVLRPFVARIAGT